MKPAALAILQAGVAVAVLLVALLCPREGEPVVLVPVAAHGDASLRPLAALGVSVVGPGRISGSLVVYRHENFPVSAVLGLGFLPLAAPAILCGGKTPGERAGPVDWTNT